MKSTFKTLFYLKKNEPKKNGHVVIMVRITVDGDQVQFSSKLDIHPDNWDTKTGRAVINKQSADKKENLRVSSLNKTLDEIRSAITMHYTRMMNVDGYAPPEKIRINTQRSNQEDGFFQKKYTASAASARPVTTMRNTRPHSASASMLKAAPSFST